MEVPFKVICYIAGNFEGGNSLNLAVTVVVVQHSLVGGQLPSDVIDFAMLPAQRFSIVRCHVTSK